MSENENENEKEKDPSNVMTGSESENESSLNEAEAELYDRQLRLWGFEAQQRMQKSKILFSGIRGLFAEVILMTVCDCLLTCLAAYL